MRSARAGTEKESVLFIRSFADQISNLGGNWLEMEIPSKGCHRAVGDLGGGGVAKMRRADDDNESKYVFL